jgi:hypothetical protein
MRALLRTEFTFSNSELLKCLEQDKERNHCSSEIDKNDSDEGTKMQKNLRIYVIKLGFVG